MNWKDYEIYITQYFQRLYPSASISHNIKRVGVVSKTNRQIDILIEEKIASFDIKIVIDCKFFNKKVDVKEVDSFVGFLADLKVNKGVIITNKGYTEAAYNRATYDTQDVELRIINFEDLEQYQSFFAFPYSGKHCVYLSAPDGWIIDVSGIHNVGVPATLYPAGLKTGAEIDGKVLYPDDGYIYLIFSKKDKKFPDLNHLLEMQKDEVLRHYRESKIEYIKSVSRDDCKTKMRVIERAEVKDLIEYTLFLDFPEVIISLTLISPKTKSNNYLKKLEWTGEKLKKGYVIFNSDSSPSVKI
jgi:hypothetical protein